MSEFGNLGFHCLIGGDVIDHMGGVTVRRGSDSRYSVIRGKQSSIGCCDFSPQKVASPSLAVNDSCGSDLESL